MLPCPMSPMYAWPYGCKGHLLPPWSNENKVRVRLGWFWDAVVGTRVRRFYFCWSSVLYPGPWSAPSQQHSAQSYRTPSNSKYLRALLLRWCWVGTLGILRVGAHIIQSYVYWAGDCCSILRVNKFGRNPRIERKNCSIAIWMVIAPTLVNKVRFYPSWFCVCICWRRILWRSTMSTFNCVHWIHGQTRTKQSILFSNKENLTLSGRYLFMFGQMQVKRIFDMLHFILRKRKFGWLVRVSRRFSSVSFP
jgi:hypothetical protein